MQDRPLNGRVALVTGAGRGIGRAIATTLAAAGARTALSARSHGQLLAVQREIEALGQVAASFIADVSREADVRSLVDEVVSHFGRLDIVVNNAGTAVEARLEETTLEQWDRVMAVNARGTFLVCREAIPHLRRQRPAYIVNITSVVGVKGYASQAAYSASKHAVMGLTKALAREVQADGIRVHAVAPGGVDTGMVRHMRPDLEPAALMRPEEIAEIVLFLVTRRGNAVIDQVDVRREASLPWA